MAPVVALPPGWLEVWRFDGGRKRADELDLFADEDGVFRAYTPEGAPFGAWRSYEEANTWLSEDEYSPVRRRERTPQTT